MSKEVVKKDTELVAANAEMMDAFGAPQVDSSDVIIPKLRVMQAMSEKVTEGEATFGDLYDTMSDSVIGNAFKGSTVKVIPFFMSKMWIIVKAAGDEFVRIEDFTKDNASREWEFTEDGVDLKAKLVYRFYCVRPEDTSLPYVVDFGGTSKRTAKELATQMYVKNRSAGKAPCGKVIELGAKKESNDKGTFAVLTIKTGEDTSMELMQECLKWFNTVQAGEAKVQDEAPQAEEANPQF